VLEVYRKRFADFSRINHSSDPIKCIRRCEGFVVNVFGVSRDLFDDACIGGHISMPVNFLPGKRSVRSIPVENVVLSIWPHGISRRSTASVDGGPIHSFRWSCPTTQPGRGSLLSTIYTAIWHEHWNRSGVPACRQELNVDGFAVRVGLLCTLAAGFKGHILYVDQLRNHS
jgi:hypothetical protein